MVAGVSLLSLAKKIDRVVPWQLPAVLMVAVLLQMSHIGRSTEWRTLDWRTQTRAHFQKSPDERMGLIIFDDDTYTNLVTWPPSREYHASLVELLSHAKVSVVAFDVIMDARRDDGGDPLMANAVADARTRGLRTVTGAFTSDVVVVEDAPAKPFPTRPITDFKGNLDLLVGDDSSVKPFPELRAVSDYGFVDQPREADDSILREPPLVVRVGKDVYPTLGLQTLMNYFDVAPEAVRVRLGDAIYLPTKTQGEIRIPVMENGRFLLNYRYEADAAESNFTVYGYRKLLIGLHEKFTGAQQSTPPPAVDGKILLVGQYITGNPDAGPTPRSSMAPLPLFHANLINNVLANDYARHVPAWIVWVTMFALVLAGYKWSATWSLSAMGTFALFGVILYVALAFALWGAFSLWLPLVHPLTGFIATQFWMIARRARNERLAKEQIRGTFNSYLSPALLSRVMAKGGLSTVESERKAVTILFSDLRDFTSWSENTKEDVLIAQLNEYLSAMVECIHLNGGTLHKFIGDAVMAVWGDLVSEGADTDAARCCTAALEMQTCLDELNKKWAAKGLHTLRMGIGINYGVVLAGNVGSPRRMEFTVIGDAVNLASRLESLNKQLLTTILVGEGVHSLISNRFELRALGGTTVKGKAQPIQVFELIGQRRD